MTKEQMIKTMMLDYEVELNAMSNEEFLAYWNQMKQILAMDEARWAKVASKMKEATDSQEYGNGSF